MIIAAIRDRLMDYFMQPFAAPGIPQLLSAISRQVTNETESDIAQAPHQFEVWKLGQVDDQGHITVERVYLCDCSSLVRSRVRQEPTDGQPAPALRKAASSQPSTSGGPDMLTTAQPAPDAPRVGGQATKGAQALSGAPGSNRQPGGLIDTNKTVERLS